MKIEDKPGLRYGIDTYSVGDDKFLIKIKHEKDKRITVTHDTDAERGQYELKFYNMLAEDIVKLGELIRHAGASADVAMGMAEILNNRDLRLDKEKKK